jgi:hypothetical protein
MYRGPTRDGISVNARCLDPGTVAGMRTRAFDGANWDVSREREDMVKIIIAVVAAFALSSPAFAQKKSCDELKGEIEAKIKKNGVDKFSLDVVEKDAQAEGKVVGTCDGGAKKIVYKRG